MSAVHKYISTCVQHVTNPESLRSGSKNKKDKTIQAAHHMQNITFLGSTLGPVCGRATVQVGTKMWEVT